jgi:hypothetical protein
VTNERRSLNIIIIEGSGSSFHERGGEIFMKSVLLILGALSAILVLAQLVMGQLIVGGSIALIKSHQHTGYLTVLVTVVYIGLSLAFIASTPVHRKT